SRGTLLLHSVVQAFCCVREPRPRFRERPWTPFGRTCRQAGDRARLRSDIENPGAAIRAPATALRPGLSVSSAVYRWPAVRRGMRPSPPARGDLQPPSFALWDPCEIPFVSFLS